MQNYHGADKGSGVAAYQVGENYIRVMFKDGTVYLYTSQTTGSSHVDAMKALAEKGVGLNTYINQHIRKAYERREK